MAHSFSLQRTCVVDSCAELARDILSGRCTFHEALSAARDLTPEGFDRFREELATTAPLTDEEHRVRRAKSALGRVEWSARDLKRAKVAARSAGATDGQVKSAVQRGKAEAR